MKDKNQSQGIWITNVPCIDCSSQDNLSLYEKEDGTIDGYCRSIKCDAGAYKSPKKLSESFLSGEYGIPAPSTNKTTKRRETVVRKVTAHKKPKQPITAEQGKAIWSKTSAKGNGFRGQDDSILKEYGVRTEYDENTGGVKNRYYPVFKDLKGDGKRSIVLYKQRIVIPKKDFRAIGLNDETVDLFGESQCKPKKDSKILLEAGEENVLAAKRMIQLHKKPNHKDIDVVCSSHSESAQMKQIQAKYDFFDTYDEIIISMDEDATGLLAVEKLISILPEGKVKILNKQHGDANDYLTKGLTREWVADFYKAQKPKLAGITGSSELLEDMYNNISFEKCPLPDYMSELNDMLEGGYDFGTFNIIAGDTSVGKTTHVNEISTYIVEKAVYKPLILSLEAKKSVLAKQYLSLSLGTRLGNFKSKDELKEYIEKHKQEVDTFLYRDGENTFEVIDDRARLTSIDDTFNMIERAIRSLGCRVIIIDPASDLTDSLSNEQQATFNSRIKALMASHNVCIIGIYHTRKLDGTNKDGKRRIEPNRYDIYGSKTTINSATTITLIWRDAGAEDDEERNTTYASLDKNRDHAVTGRAGEWIYVKDKHRVYNKRKWLEDKVEEF